MRAILRPAVNGGAVLAAVILLFPLPGGAQTPNQSAIPLPFRPKTAADVLALLEEQIGAVRGDTTLTTVERARVVGYPSANGLDAIEAGGIAARREAVEAVLEARRVRVDGVI